MEQVDVGVGYRRLQIGEIISAGDEFFPSISWGLSDDEMVWTEITPDRVSFGKPVHDGHVPFRRKLPPAEIVI
jgi:hypothetical protein